MLVCISAAAFLLLVCWAGCCCLAGLVAAILVVEPWPGHWSQSPPALGPAHRCSLPPLVRGQQAPGVSYPVIALCDGDSNSEGVRIYLICVSTSRSIETSHYDENTLNMIDIVKKITLFILDFGTFSNVKYFECGARVCGSQNISRKSVTQIIAGTVRKIAELFCNKFCK